ncbi:MAG: Excinuclease ABC subunit C [Candidatus Yanofskybacteria bacterium GW2011_GWA1_39_13]|uniref:Excinuclease ABC subunit C n=1 Tax=Yanofskybacteria sp. (strain GW2011_GWA1_39_13) TaxID=1619019 RepID=A0A0G0QLA8_YANXG|nr:MAG: Excinuclease ABC subunit C [Candidatus Yanofskybacteria bacterium GW2011_GWA1_39_13]
MLNSTLKEQIRKLPPDSGIYIFKDSRHKPIYVGKASNLKNRLNSYLRTDDPRIKKMIDSANILKFIETESDIEALILESQLIKKFRPQFNIVMRDDKQYFFVGFTKNEMPRIYLTHQLNGDKYIGPFTDGSALKTTLRFLRSVFPYCTCTQSHHNYCLNYHIGKCLGFCCLKSSPSGKDRKNYLNNIKSIEKILSGKKNSFVKELRKEADDFAKKDNFEKAIELRDKITKLERIFRNAKIIKNSDILKAHRSGLGSLLKMSKPIIKIEGYDVSNIQGLHATGSMVTFVDGQPNKNFYRKFKIQTKNTPDDTAMLKEILERRFRHSEWPFPDLILIDGGKGQVSTAVKVLKKMSIKIQVIGMSKNERHMGHQLIIPGRKTPLPLTKLSPADKNLLLTIDSEAHRFAIEYYRKLHRKPFR